MAQQIIHNTGINYTLYYNVLNYFKTIMKNHPSIGVATYGDLQHIDLKEYPMYPIGNVNITNTIFGTNVTTYTIELVVADKGKNKNNQSEGERNEQTIPFFGVDDDVYIHSNTLGILNDLTSYTQRGIAGFDIDGEIECIPFVDRFDNGLAGWVATFSLTTHNDKNRCLFFLINPSGSGYLIRECLSGDEYRAVLTENVVTGSVISSVNANIGGYRGTVGVPLACYTIVSTLNGVDDWDYVNLPVLAIPYQSYDSCSICELWIQPKIWSTTPENWSSGSSVAFRTWSGD